MKVTSLFNNHLLCPAPAVQSEGTMAEVRRFHQACPPEDPARQARNEAATRASAPSS